MSLSMFLIWLFFCCGCSASGSFVAFATFSIVWPVYPDGHGNES